jgi:5'-phosphate synthase pdxT subunit
MLKVLEEEGLFDAIRSFAAQRPVLGTCAGAILMATEVSHPAQRSLGLIDMAIERNAYGRQVDSHISKIPLTAEFSQRTGGRAPEEPLEAVFIRAPIIRRVGPGGIVLLRHQNDPILVEQGSHLAATFHPELTSETRVHGLFLAKAAAAEPVSKA